MSDVDDDRRSAMAFLSRPGITEVLLVLRYSNGRATPTELRDAGVSRPLETLRALAASGYVTASGVSLDDVVPDGAVFTLSPQGVAAADVMVAMQAIGRLLAERRRAQLGLARRISVAIALRWARSRPARDRVTRVRPG